MRVVSFDPYRTLTLEGVETLKPEHFMRHRDLLQQADWVLYPDYWQLGALVYGLKCRIFPNLPSYLIGHSKVEMTRAFEAALPGCTPETHIAANSDHEAERLWELMTTPFVAKNPRSSMGEGVWLIESRSDWEHYRRCTDILYVQELLPIDRDIRVVVIGDEVIAAYWRLQSNLSFHNNIARGGIIDISPVPEAAIALAQELARRLDINHAGFDIAMVGDHPYVFEMNRLFGNQGIPGGAGAVTDAVRRYLGANSSPEKPRPLDAAGGKRRSPGSRLRKAG